MKNIIVANLKMNQTFSESETYLERLNAIVEHKKENERIVVCLPYTSLVLARKYGGGKLLFGAQNLHEEESGRYTGEISVRMLADCDVKFVILGHSERRKYFGETNEKVNKKIKTALRYGLEVVLCVGETRVQKNTNKTFSVLKKQLEECLVGIYENELKSVTIAYEPVWAIGTGKVADSRDITEASKYIRSIISEHYSETAGANQNIIYGGSLTEKNAQEIFKNKEIVGALIGGASLDVEKFGKII